VEVRQVVKVPVHGQAKRAPKDQRRLEVRFALRELLEELVDFVDSCCKARSKLDFEEGKKRTFQDPR
jgi:hypothetical protein